MNVNCRITQSLVLIVSSRGRKMVGKKKKRKFGWRLVEFNYCEYQNTWYWIRHAVDVEFNYAMRSTMLQDKLVISIGQNTNFVYFYQYKCIVVCIVDRRAYPIPCVLILTVIELHEPPAKLSILFFTVTLGGGPCVPN
jgi:hypothetical protein